ncbi:MULTISPECIES: hypothetical protein [Olivibacter]|uniref:Uncharacterized protein n=1 Tax=Olivibacter jilunii TaxID=985016 RepID=A0ABW6B0K2_9SPHI|nr:hypothetical protein [Olivibacter sp. UJ_SKK_5.1]MDX3917163.1 hypothetical protein [Pseudosphingobacterium sp.]
MKRGIILISFFLSIFACDKEDREDKECMLLMYVPLPSLEEVYGCTDTRYALHIDLKETHELIRTKHTYDEKVTGSCHPAIDFEKYDLLIGRKGLKSGNHSITYELKKSCTGEERLVVTFHQDISAVAATVTYHVLLPKADSNRTIAVETKIVY